MLKVNGNGLLIVVSGPSGAGKDTICNELVKENDNIWLSVSMTSRSIRGQEQEGKDYFFVTKEEFEEKIKSGIFLEYAIYNDNYYGTPKDKIEQYLNKGIDVIDCGVPVLSMHSPYEVTSKIDLYEAYRAYKAFWLN